MCMKLRAGEYFSKISPHIYYTIDYVPTSKIIGYINRIECQGREEQLQDCVIEPASSRQPICTMIGTVAGCYYCKYTTKHYTIRSHQAMHSCV